MIMNGDSAMRSNFFLKADKKRCFASKSKVLSRLHFLLLKCLRFDRVVLIKIMYT